GTGPYPGQWAAGRHADPQHAHAVGKPQRPVSDSEDLKTAVIVRVIRAIGVDTRDPARSRINSGDALVISDCPDGTIAVDEFLGVCEAGRKGEVVHCDRPHTSALVDQPVDT